MKNKKAVSEGYAKLFQRLCEINHIQSEVIEGYARTKPYQIGNKISVNHSWNAAYIDTSWYFFDVTWAAGFCTENEETGKLVKFTRNFQNYYWLPTFERLARNHYPKNAYWTKPYSISINDFLNKPHYYSTVILDNISNEHPSSGMLDFKKNDTIHFSFDNKKDIRFIQVNSNVYRNPSLWTTVYISKRKTKLVRDSWAEKKQIYIPFKKQGHSYNFYYVVKDDSLYYLELLFDFEKAIRYKINIRK